MADNIILNDNNIYIWYFLCRFSFQPTVILLYLHIGRFFVPAHLRQNIEKPRQIGYAEGAGCISIYYELPTSDSGVDWPVQTYDLHHRKIMNICTGIKHTYNLRFH